MDNRKRKDYTKIPKPIQALDFVEEGYMQEVLIPIEYRPVEIDNVIPGYYYVDNFGNLYNKDGKIMKPSLINSGYLCYKLRTIDGKCKNILAHRLFKIIFDPIDNMDKMTVNHIDGNHRNNELRNLEWLTQKENNDKKNLLSINYGTGNYHAKFTYAQLKQILIDLNKGMKYSDILRDIGMEVNDNNMDYIGNIKRGRTYKREVEDILKDGLND